MSSNSIRRFLIAWIAACGSIGAARAADAPATQPTTQVSIDNFNFTPQALTIDLNTTVTWTNHDDVPHTVTSSIKPRAFNSGALDTDEKFSFTFTKPGVYSYFCAVHPHMTGQIIVKSQEIQHDK